MYKAPNYLTSISRYGLKGEKLEDYRKHSHALYIASSTGRPYSRINVKGEHHTLFEYNLP